MRRNNSNMFNRAPRKMNNRFTNRNIANNNQEKTRRYKAKAGDTADSGVAASEKELEEKFGKARTCKLLSPRHVS
jgi:hypothetical protein